MPKNAIAVSVIVLYATTVAAIGWRGKRAPSPDYAAGVNDGLTMAMVVIVEAREKHEIVNWLVVERRAAKKLGVIRAEPWLGAER